MEQRNIISGPRGSEEKHGLKLFAKPWIFSCTVNDKALTATVEGWYDLPVQYAFYVSFSDGFSARFVSDEAGWWAEQKGGKAYVDAIDQHLNDLLRRSIQC